MGKQGRQPTLNSTPTSRGKSLVTNPLGKNQQQQPQKQSQEQVQKENQTQIISKTNSSGYINDGKNYKIQTNETENCPEIEVDKLRSTWASPEEYNRETEDALDDAHARFVLNLPPEELETADRIFFQLEQAYWFYDDFHCDSNPDAVYRFSCLKSFAREMFGRSPLLSHLLPNKFESMWEEFGSYKRKISTYGTILMNKDCTKVVLCRTYHGQKFWTFPAGKVNYGEKGVEAACRETYEETGFDPSCQHGRTREMRDEMLLLARQTDNPSVSAVSTTSDDGMVGRNSNLMKLMKKNLGWQPVRDDDALVYTEQDKQQGNTSSSSGKRRTCYVCRGVPEDFPFSPVARKEVSAVEWHDLSDLPKKSFAVLPFVGQLHRWIRKNTKKQGKSSGCCGGGGGGGTRSVNTTPKRDRSNKRGGKKGGGGGGGEGGKGRSVATTGENAEAGAAPEGGATPKRNRSRSRGRGSSGNSGGGRGRVKEGDDVAASGLAEVGDVDGWSEGDMFLANERLIGRRVEYDGNPHKFHDAVAAGGSVADPHRFHVVGGAFLNSSSGGGMGGEGISLAPPPDASRLQPLFARQQSSGNAAAGGEVSDESELQPFFTDEGETPWGELVNEAASLPAPVSVGGAKHGVVGSATATSTAPGAIGPRSPLATNDPWTEAADPLKDGGSLGGAMGAMQDNDPGLALLNLLQGSRQEQQQQQQQRQKQQVDDAALGADNHDGSCSSLFLTDLEITARSQRQKLGVIGDASCKSSTLEPRMKAGKKGGADDEDFEFLKRWAQSLKKGADGSGGSGNNGSSFVFPEFKFDLEPIMKAIEMR